MQNISHIGRAALRSLLLSGLSLTTAISLGVISPLSLASEAGLKGKEEEALIQEAVRCALPRTASSSGGGGGTVDGQAAEGLGEGGHGLPRLSTTSSHPPRNAGTAGLSRVRSELLLLLQSIPQGEGNSLGSHLAARRPLALLTGLSLSLPGAAHRLSQAEVAEALGLTSPLSSVFQAGHIESRYLAELRTISPHALPPSAGQGQLTEKHLRWARALLAPSVRAACADAGCDLSDVRCVTVCSSTGYLLPGLSAYLLADLGLRRGCARLDIVGMGCHAGLNSLQAAANWAHAHPGSIAVACAVEVCSATFLSSDAAQSRSEAINHAVVNSLFSDGAFAAVLLCPHTSATGPAIAQAAVPAHYAALHDFASVTVPEAIHTMEYHWSEGATQFWFDLSEDAPYAVGAGLAEMVEQQREAGIDLSFVRHWVLHTGGQTVIDAAAASLGLDLPELEGSVRALKRYGNSSSTSFMFAYDEFLQHPPSPISTGDVGTFVTMGPGAGLELCVWTAGSRVATPSCVPLRGWEPAQLLPPRSSLVQHVADPPTGPSEEKAVEAHGDTVPAPDPVPTTFESVTPGSRS